MVLLVCALCVTVGSLFLPQGATGQYIFLDANGDSSHTAADRLPLGTTTVDMWLDLERNRDGTPAQCTEWGDVLPNPLDLGGIDVELQTTGGPVAWGNPESPLFETVYVSKSSTSLHLGLYRWTLLPAGKYKIASFWIQVLSGPPVIEFVSWNTQLTTSCNGSWYIPLESESPPPSWRDADGLMPLFEPKLAGPSKVTGDSLLQFDITASASDGDSIIAVWMDASSLPSGQDVTLSTHGTAAHFQWLVSCPLGLSYPVTFHASTLRGRSAALTTVLGLALDRPPVVSAPATHDRRVGSNNVLVTASDPDGDTIMSLHRTLSNGRITTFSLDATNTSGTLGWSSSSADTLDYSILFTASNALVGSATTVVVGDRGPILSVPPAVQVVRDSEMALSVSVMDPNGDPVPTVTADLSALPPGHNATFNPTTRMLKWRPTISTVGSFPVVFRALNRLEGQASTEIQVLTIPPIPAITVRPVRGSRPAEVIVDASGSYDRDGDLVTYAFNLGNNLTTDTRREPYTSHVFSEAGVETISVVVVDNEGAQAVASTTFRVHPPQPYMFLDVNGDSLNTSSDRMGPVGAPTQATVWLRTDTSKGGDAAECSVGNGLLTVNSYEFIVRATGGRVTWSNFVNLQPGMDVSFEEAISDSEYHNGFGGLEALSPGLHRLASLEITAVEGSPRIEIVDAPSFPGVHTTSFGSRCEGLDTDNTLKLGTDWADADGLRIYGSGAHPVVNAPWTVQAYEGIPCSIRVEVLDTDRDPIETVTLDEGALPPGESSSMEFDPVSRTALLHYLPGFTASRVEPYSLTFRAQSGSPSLSGTAVTQLTVLNTNRGPIASAGGPYIGTVNRPVVLTGAPSYDPDGDPLVAAWDFGDGATSAVLSPQHSYTSAGSYRVILTVTDESAADNDTTNATIEDGLSPRLFSTGADSILSLVSGRPSWCLYLEAAAQEFHPSDVDPEQVALWYDGSGAIDSTGIRGGSVVAGSDVDGNEVPELTLCFSREKLRDLFAGFVGEQMAQLSVTGTLRDGRLFSGVMQQLVSGIDFGSQAHVSPNPLNPKGTLVFRVQVPGLHLIRIFDVSGRVVRTFRESVSSMGYKAVPIDATDSSGRQLSSGIYFYKIESPAGHVDGKFTVLK